MDTRYKGLLIILDGVGDRPAPLFGGLTPLEAAKTPRLDTLAAAGLCGMVDPLRPGLPVATHTGISILFGLSEMDTCKLTRGPVEAAGVELPLQAGDVALRCNFATLIPKNSGFAILDRRAGRIKEGTEELASVLKNVPLSDGITAMVRPATQHRGVLRLSGPGLSAAVSDTDPGCDGPNISILSSYALQADDVAAIRSAGALNEFIVKAHERLGAHPINRQRCEQGKPPANGIITRGAGQIRKLHSLIDHMGLRTALVAGERTVVGLGRLLNYCVYSSPLFTASYDTDLGGKVATANAALQSHELVFLHIKGTDICAHDRDPQGKKHFLEKVDDALMPLFCEDRVIGITGDHSTDSNTGKHCGDPVPSILYSPTGRRDLARSFGENTCMTGGMGRISAGSFLLSLMDAMGCVDNYRPADHFSLRSC